MRLFNIFFIKTSKSFRKLFIVFNTLQGGTFYKRRSSHEKLLKSFLFSMYGSVRSMFIFIYTGWFKKYKYKLLKLIGGSKINENYYCTYYCILKCIETFSGLRKFQKNSTWCVKQTFLFTPFLILINFLISFLYHSSNTILINFITVLGFPISISCSLLINSNSIFNRDHLSDNFQ